MAKKGIRSGNSYKNQYKNYSNEDRWIKNTRKRLLKTIKNQPNNAQAVTALKALDEGKKTYNRDNDHSEHRCKGLLTAFGFKENKATLAIQSSVFRHTSQEFSSFKGLPSAPKGDGKSEVRKQMEALGFKARKPKKRRYERKHKKTT